MSTPQLRRRRSPTTKPNHPRAAKAALLLLAQQAQTNQPNAAGNAVCHLPGPLNRHGGTQATGKPQPRLGGVMNISTIPGNCCPKSIPRTRDGCCAFKALDRSRITGEESFALSRLSILRLQAVALCAAGLPRNRRNTTITMVGFRVPNRLRSEQLNWEGKWEPYGCKRGRSLT